MKLIAEISTHKAVKESGKINIYRKGFDIDCIAPNGSRLHDKEDLEKYPEWFKDEFLYSLDNEDDVFQTMERYEENNQCNVAELNGL